MEGLFSGVMIDRPCVAIKRQVEWFSAQYSRRRADVKPRSCATTPYLKCQRRMSVVLLLPSERRIDARKQTLVGEANIDA